MGRQARPPRIPLLRYSAKDAFEHFQEGGIIQTRKDGTAEIWNQKSEALGYLTKRSHELLLKLIDQSNEH